MGFALAKGAQEVNFFKSRKVLKNPHEERAQLYQDGIAIRVKLTGGNRQLPEERFQKRVEGGNGSVRAHMSIDSYEARRSNISKLTLFWEPSIPLTNPELIAQLAKTTLVQRGWSPFKGICYRVGHRKRLADIRA